MSKQYLAQHTIDDAHTADIFGLATTTTQILSISGNTSIRIHSTTSDEFPIEQSLKDVHKLGAHHIVVSLGSGPAQTPVAASVGFAGEVKLWRNQDGIWKASGEIAAAQKKAGELWAVALSSNGQYLAGTTSDGRVNVWDISQTIVDEKERKAPQKVTEWETKGSFGMCIDLSPDGKFTVTGHESGHIYLFSSATSRLLHSLPGLIKPVRTIKFAPGSTLVAAAGDSRIIALYDPNSGEQVAQLTGHAAWITSLDWSFSGQYLVSGSLDGKVKVWDVERRACVATHSESEGKGLWAVQWLKKGEASNERYKAERFVTAGSGKSVAIYREATGG